MNISEIKDLMNQFDQSTLKEFDYKEGAYELYMNKNEHSHAAASYERSEKVVAEPLTVKAAETGSVDTAVAEKPEEPAAPAVSTSSKEITSPIVGIVYLQATPEEPALVSVGDKVKKGDVVCIVEAMKVMNEIVSDVDGIITEILVDNEQVVEFGQPIFRVQ